MISILLSCYNSNLDYLKEQLDSIFNQTEQDFELVIHLDSEDSVKNGNIRIFIDNYDAKKIRIDSGRHLGYAKAYNLLLSEAKGEYVCFCDHDDIWESDKLEIEKAYLDGHPEVDCVFGWLRWFGEKEKQEVFNISDEDISKELYFWQPIKQPTAMFRKSRFGEFDAPFDCAGDFWFWNRHKDRHYHLIPWFMVNYRRHEGEATKNKDEFRENTAKVIQDGLHGRFGVWLPIDLCRSLDRYSKTYNPNLKEEIAKAIAGEGEDG